MVHTPPQQSGPDVHASPSWMQKDALKEQRPAAHKPEQQSEPWAQALPDVRHAPLSGVHVPFVPHWPPQHCASLVQA
jgi:hypothetical protein